MCTRAVALFAVAWTVCFLCLTEPVRASKSGPNTPLEENGSPVVRLDVENVDMLISGKYDVLVLFAAPWCHHSQKVYPEFAKVAATFGTADGLLTAQVKADEETSLLSRFKVTGFPSVLFFPKDDIEKPKKYKGGRTAEDMIEYLNRKLGLDKKLQMPPEHTETLVPSTFDSFALDPDRGVLVFFYAAWSSISKDILPNIEIAAYTYRSDKNVVVAKMDVEKHPEFGLKYQVTSYPTILYFPLGEDAGVPILYENGFGVQNFIDFLNDAVDLYRMSGGDILDHAGTSEKLSGEAAKFMDAIFSNDRETAVKLSQFFHEEGENHVDGKADPSTASIEVGAAGETEYKSGGRRSGGKKIVQVTYYAHIASQTLEHGQEWPANELKRIELLLGSDEVSHEKKSEFMLKRNVLAAFQ